jgi:triosephosphate isomerase
MHGDRAGSIQLISGILSGLPADNPCEVLVCPPAVYLDAAGQALGGSDVRLGAQDTAAEDSGAHTGDVSAAMLADVGCRYVLVGHSERRHDRGESNEQVAAKFEAAGRHGLTPVLCVGERAEEREVGATEAVIAGQLDAVLSRAGVAAFADAVVAYEPVWAIGTGLTASPEQAQEVHAFIRRRMAERDVSIAASLRVLYGGSVKPANAAALFGMEDVDGGLIGGASLKAEDFLAICAAAR